MLSKKMHAVLNAQVSKELESEYIYLQMAMWGAAQNLPGLELWMKHQASEERMHAMKIYQFIIDNEGEVTLDTIPAPALKLKTPIDVFRKALAHEQKITKSIHECYAVALAEKSYPAQVMLHWFITEQVEEEATASAILKKFEDLKESPSSIYWLDKELKKRGG
jgi:ferritin